MIPSLASEIESRLRVAPGVYTLRPPGGTRRVTVRHQQVRACNLVHALVVAGVLGRSRARAGVELAVVGAGVAGVTAATLAKRMGIGPILLLERQEVDFWNLRQGTTRWLHPYRFLWPEDEWRRETTMLPVLNWSAGYAECVAQQLEYDQSIASDKTVADVRVSSGARGVELRYRHAKCASATGAPEKSRARVAILADGLGLELRDPNAVNSSYWLDDNLHREEPYVRGAVEYAVVGNGDGALTDLLRVRLKDHRGGLSQADIIESIVGRNGPAAGRRARDLVNAIEERCLRAIARAGVDRARINEALELAHGEYRELVRSTRRLRDHLDKDRLRRLTRAVQFAETPFGAPSFPVHRLLRAMLSFVDGHGTEIVRGRARESARTTGGVAIGLVDSPAGSGAGLREVHRLVWRAGTQPPAQKGWAALDGKELLREASPADFEHAERERAPSFAPRIVRAESLHLRREAERFAAPLRIATAAGTPPRRSGFAGGGRDPYPTLVVGVLDRKDDERARPGWASAAPVSLFYSPASASLWLRTRALARLGVRSRRRLSLGDDDVVVLEIVHVDGSERADRHRTYAGVTRSNRARVTASCRIAVTVGEAPRGDKADRLRDALFAGARLIVNFTEDDEASDAAWQDLWTSRRDWLRTAIVRCRTGSDSTFFSATPCIELDHDDDLRIDEPDFVEFVPPPR